MIWTKNFSNVTKQSKCCILVFRKHHNSVLNVEKSLFISSRGDRGYAPTVSLQQAGYCSEHFQDIFVRRNRTWGVKLPCDLSRNTFAQRKYPMLISNPYSYSTHKDPDLSREFFVQLWSEDRKRKILEERQRKRAPNHAQFCSRSNSQFPPKRELPEAPVIDEGFYTEMNPFLKQPPTIEPLTGALEPSSPEEAKVAPLLARSHLLITRDIEWANLVWSIEQESRFLIIDVHYPQSPVGAIREQSNFLMRQLLRTRRPFVAHIYDGKGNELFKVRRPFWWITSSIFVEINGKEIGVVHRRWHLWRRIYDLYLGNKQFAAVDNPGLWNWTFTLQDIDGAVLAEINRNWRGVGFEVFTDAGQYVIRFGTAHPTAALLPGIEELEIKRPLTLSERAVALALAISLDCDYFSRHGGWMFPFIVATE